ncbi:hypothetical protein Fot_22744 [Forsythia ovata]|uniref:Uncharacterized protein n=1 Tax=Forsythia ovata TaxID=205694 RepID=A0ABD1UYL1_9LAMI
MYENSFYEEDLAFLESIARHLLDDSQASVSLEWLLPIATATASNLVVKGESDHHISFEMSKILTFQMVALPERTVEVVDVPTEALQRGLTAAEKVYGGDKGSDKEWHLRVTRDV